MYCTYTYKYTYYTYIHHLHSCCSLAYAVFIVRNILLSAYLCLAALSNTTHQKSVHVAQIYREFIGQQSGEWVGGMQMGRERGQKNQGCREDRRGWKHSPVVAWAQLGELFSVRMGGTWGPGAWILGLTRWWCHSPRKEQALWGR